MVSFKNVNANIISHKDVKINDYNDPLYIMSLCSVDPLKVDQVRLDMMSGSINRECELLNCFSAEIRPFSKKYIMQDNAESFWL